jgi:hypothetical protein
VLTSVAILSPSDPFLLIATPDRLPLIRLQSSLIRTVVYIDSRSVLVEVLLRVLSSTGGLVLQKLVPEAQSRFVSGYIHMIIVHF